MLSPHEFATLVLVNEAPEQADLNFADVGALMANQLVTLVELGPNGGRPQVTLQEYLLLKAFGRPSGCACQRLPE